MDKRFYFDIDGEKEWQAFWNDLWNQAKAGLQQASELYLLGYSMPKADARARERIFSASHSKITICCGSQTADVAREFRMHSFVSVTEAQQTRFENWVDAWTA